MTADTLTDVVSAARMLSAEIARHNQAGGEIATGLDALTLDALMHQIADVLGGDL